MSKIQYRGHCQCCGRVQAVPDRHMSKHGYTVQHGWFSGVCSGHHYEPIEVSRAQADKIIAMVRAEAAQLRAKADDYEEGRCFPATAKDGYRMCEVKHHMIANVIPFADAPAYRQREAVNEAIFRCKNRAHMGDEFANSLQRLADNNHGRPLQEVKKEDGPRQILSGERRTLAGGRVAESTYVSSGSVRYSYINAYGKTFNSSMSTRAWRLLPEAAAA